MTLKSHCRPQVIFFPIIKVIPQFFIKQISSNKPQFKEFMKFKGVIKHLIPRTGPTGLQGWHI